MVNQQTAELHEASGRFLAIAEREVGRIILDIHDGPVQNIFAALSQLYVAQRRMAQQHDEPPEELERIRRSISLLENALNEIRTFMGTFRPPEFERRDLVSILEGLLIQHEEMTGNPVDLVLDGALPAVELPVKISLYRILQEALSNAVRHGEADQHTVTLSSATASLVMEVADNGRGFDVAAILRNPMAGHFGLDGMRERVGLLGGHFSIESVLGTGTRIRVEVPVT
ncbi:MAG: sensor histidine kinase [Candidatus Viridilinea halotolerans]|uniref:histidine kinase n=1 Tax=Candidatus Viridilinea halotolerans TaxID=2491704 RepID=A0A426U3E1_9CHLR|nr:MAG: sensor histidine kinase [Candidatus Viridilinea halotolerans]